MTVRTIPERVEKLARAMCEALDINPDDRFAHGASYDPYPRINRDGLSAVPAIALYSPNWHQFSWAAHKWIFENSGGELPVFGESGSHK